MAIGREREITERNGQGGEGREGGVRGEGTK